MPARVDSSETVCMFSSKVIFSFEFEDLLDKYGLHDFQKDFLSVEISMLEKKLFFIF